MHPASPELRRLLTTRPRAAAELAAALGMSQPTISRLLAQHDDIVTMRTGRRVQYGLARTADFDVPASVFELSDPTERARHIGELTPIEPDMWWIEGRCPDVTSALFDDLPWWMHDLRPEGFLGRQIPTLHPELGLAPDIRRWGSDDVMHYLTRFGTDGVGALVVGQTMLTAALESRLDPVSPIASSDRQEYYSQAANRSLQLGPVGSSAAGERPKFLAVRERDGRPVPVLVKFSPPASGSAAAQRWSDLLIAEHLALKTLDAHGHSAATSEIIQADGRTFLEVVRFDRQPGGGRVGQVALLAVDAHYIGQPRAWAETGDALAERGVISLQDAGEIRFLQAFAQLTGNTDRHFGNLSVRLRGATITGLAPAYDTAPMRYAPVQGEVVQAVVQPVQPTPQDAAIAQAAGAAALDFWDCVQDDALISDGFKELIPAERANVQRWLTVAGWLPE